MTVVIGASNVSQRARGGAGFADPQALSGLRRMVTGIVTNPTPAFTLSRFHLTDLPSDCYLTPQTLFGVVGWGFAQVNIGTETAVTALGTVARGAAATFVPIAADDVRRQQELWQALGLAANPGGFIGLFAHATANATGAGSMPFYIEYIHRV